MEIFIKSIYRILWFFGLIHVPEWDNSRPVFRYIAEERPDPVDEGPRAWSRYQSFDGVNLSPDFRDWSRFDQEVVEERGLSERQIENYKTIKSFVILKYSNDQVALSSGKSLSMVQKLAPAVRDMIERRYSGEFKASEYIIEYF